MNTREGGFTIIEVLMAMVVLAIGIIALAGASAMVTRMVGRGRTSTFTAQVATRRLDWLRNAAASTATPCTAASFANGSVTTPQNGENVTESWTIINGVTSSTRKVTVAVTYKKPRGGGTQTDTVSTTISCIQ